MKELVTSFRQNISHWASVLVILFCLLFTLATTQQNRGFQELLSVEEFFLADGEVDFIVVKKVELQHHQKCHSKFKKAAIFNSVFFTSEVPTAPANVLSFYPTHSLVSNLPVLHQVFRI